MTKNNIKSMHKYLVVADLWVRSADVVVSICPTKYIRTGVENM